MASLWINKKEGLKEPTVIDVIISFVQMFLANSDHQISPPVHEEFRKGLAQFQLINDVRNQPLGTLLRTRASVIKKVETYKKIEEKVIALITNPHNCIQKFRLNASYVLEPADNGCVAAYRVMTILCLTSATVNALLRKGQATQAVEIVRACISTIPEISSLLAQTELLLDPPVVDFPTTADPLVDESSDEEQAMDRETSARTGNPWRREVFYEPYLEHSDRGTDDMVTAAESMCNAEASPKEEEITSSLPGGTIVHEYEDLGDLAYPSEWLSKEEERNPFLPNYALLKEMEVHDDYELLGFDPPTLLPHEVPDDLPTDILQSTNEIEEFPDLGNIVLNPLEEPLAPPRGYEAIVRALELEDSDSDADVCSL